MPPLPAETTADENLRLIGGGNDLFVTVGIGMLFAGLIFSLQAVPGLDRLAGTLILAAAIWGVAEFVTRQKRMRLASTVLGLGFAACIAVVLGDFAAGFDGSLNEVYQDNGFKADP